MAIINPFEWNTRFEAALSDCLLPSVSHSVFLKLQDQGILDYTKVPETFAQAYLMDMVPSAAIDHGFHSTYGTSLGVDPVRDIPGVRLGIDGE